MWKLVKGNAFPYGNEGIDNVSERKRIPEKVLFLFETCYNNPMSLRIINELESR
jgi:hypothetical protein